MVVKSLDLNNRRIHNEAGAVLPIVALLSLALLSSIAILAIDVFMVKDAQRRLRIAVDAICHRVAPLALNQTKAYAEFERRIDTLAAESNKPFLRQAKITDARLIIPVMPEEFDRSSPSIWELSAGTACNELVSEPHSATVRKIFCNSIDIIALKHLNRPHSIGSLFPAQTLINNNSYGNAPNAGMTTGCEVVGETKRWFNLGGATSKVPMKVKSLWWTPVRAMLRSKPGLTIAIAPEMTTNKESDLTRFPTGLSLGSQITYNHNFLDRFSALSRIQNNPSFASGVFVGGADHSYSNGTRSEKLSKLNLSFDNPNPDGPLADAAVSCSNPVVLVRNTLTSTILELASRHGQLRDSTEVLIVNPSAPNSEGNNQSPPSLIAKFGEDIAKKTFQLPYVFSKQPFGDFGTVSYNNPFKFTSSQLFQHQLLFSNQLRMCYHLYDRQDSQGGIERYSTSQTNDIFDNSAFEPPIFNSTFETSLRSSPYSPQLAEPLDQKQPWVKGLGTGNEQRLSAAQAVSALGSIQNCPAKAKFCSSPDNCAEVCEKNDSAREPDLVGLFRYLIKDVPSASEVTAAGTKGTKLAFFPAIQEPGLYPFNQDTESDQNIPFPFENANYHSAESISTHIFLVLHTIPQNLERIADFIADISSGLVGPARPITVVYIPVTPSEASRQAINRLKSALSPVDASGVPLPQIIPPALFTLAPTGDGVTPLTNNDMAAYWHKLLTDEDDQNDNGESIVDIAQAIFSDRILRLELRY